MRKWASPVEVIEDKGSRGKCHWLVHRYGRHSVSEQTRPRFAFPRYTDNDRCNANSASNALNKWLKANFRDDIVVHGFRHAMRDRLEPSVARQR